MTIKSNLIGELVELVQSLPGYKEADRVYVSVYRRHQCYGGPEEGGWWYDRNEFIGAVEFQDRESAEKWLAVAKHGIENRNREEAPERYRAMANLPDPDKEPLPDFPDCEGYIPQGWDDGGELYITIEESRGEQDNSNEPRPHYE